MNIKLNLIFSHNSSAVPFAKYIIAILVSLLLSSMNSEAEVYIALDGSDFVNYDTFPTSDEAHQRCIAFVESISKTRHDCTYQLAGFRFSGLDFNGTPNEIYTWGSDWIELYAADGTHYYRHGEFTINRCKSPSIFNISTGACGNDQQKGSPPALSCEGDPVNVAVGNVFDTEVDYQPAGASPLSFSRAYNSLDGIWRHNFSTYLRFAIGKLSLVMADGRESFFNTTDTTATAYPTELGTLTKQPDGTWFFTSESNEQFTFDSTGRLITQSTADGKQLQLSYTASQVTVTDQFGQSLSYTEDANHQPLSLTTPGVQVAYNYDANNHLTSAAKTMGSLTEQRQYRYEDTQNTGLLTSVINERGVVASSWTYDAQGRAISSQSAKGIGSVQIAYNDSDGSRAVTNELGKVATYKFVNIGGVQRVSAIVGSPSTNCPASNSTYGYDTTRGLLTQKTDALNNITTYTYNDRGLETQRVEASNTTHPRTTNTEWDPSRFLRTKVTGPTHTTVYTYDAQGRQLTQVTTSNSSK